MSEHELTVRHAGDEYFVVVDVTWENVDDSFDHAFGTQRDSHWEAEDYDVITVVNTDGEELDAEAVPGLHRAIHLALQDYDYHP